MATVTTFWQAQYRNPFNKNWTATGPQFATEEEALAWYEREIAEPIRPHNVFDHDQPPGVIGTELRIVSVTTATTLTEIAKGVVPTKRPEPKKVTPGVVNAAPDDDEQGGCEGHESLDGAHMGETVYCDGSCR